MRRGSSHVPQALVGLGLLLGLVVVSMGVGAVWIPPGVVWRSLMGGLSQSGNPAWEEMIVLSLRLPRALLGALGGATLGMAGAAMQGLFRNPMADPGILGVSAGAALGAVLALYGLTFVTGAYAAPFGAFVGALATAFLVYAVAARRGRVRTDTLLLAGIAIAGMASSLTALVLSLTLAEWEVGREMVAWLMGGLDRASWGELLFLILPVGAGAVGLAAHARGLDALATGEDSALTLGVDVPTLTRRILVWTSLMTAATVSVMGVVAFVGLIVPHMVRRVVGASHGRVMAWSALAGALVLTATDIVCRLAPSGDFRLGVVTSLLGGPFFLFLLVRREQRVAP